MSLADGMVAGRSLLGKCRNILAHAVKQRASKSIKSTTSHGPTTSLLEGGRLYSQLASALSRAWMLSGCASSVAARADTRLMMRTASMRKHEDEKSVCESVRVSYIATSCLAKSTLRILQCRIL